MFNQICTSVLEIQVCTLILLIHYTVNKIFIYYFCLIFCCFIYYSWSNVKNIVEKLQFANPSLHEFLILFGLHLVESCSWKYRENGRVEV